MIDLIAAIDSVKFSSKSELSSRFFGRLKFSVRFEYLGLPAPNFGHRAQLAAVDSLTSLGREFPACVVKLLPRHPPFRLMRKIGDASAGRQCVIEKIDDAD